jgi:hypothetical protein
MILQNDARSALATPNFYANNPLLRVYVRWCAPRGQRWVIGKQKLRRVASGNPFFPSELLMSQQ